MYGYETMQPLVFNALYQGRPVPVELRTKCIFLSWEEREEYESSFTGSLKIYYDPLDIPERPYNTDVDGSFVTSVEEFIRSTFNVDVDVNYTESGAQGDDYADFFIENSEQLYCRIADRGLNPYITLDPNIFRDT